VSCPVKEGEKLREEKKEESDLNWRTPPSFRSIRPKTADEFI
jgi:hypothetical protein